MASHDVFVTVGFQDDAGTIAEREYLLRLQYDDVLENYGDINTQAAALITALDVATMDKIAYYFTKVKTIGGGAAPNDASNNQIVAYTRYQDVNGVKGSIEVPAWDTALYEMDENGLLNALYNTDASAIGLVTRNPDTGDNWKVSVDWTQSRTRKRGIKNLV